MCIGFITRVIPAGRLKKALTERNMIPQVSNYFCIPFCDLSGPTIGLKISWRVKNCTERPSQVTYRLHLLLSLEYVLDWSRMERPILFCPDEWHGQGWDSQPKQDFFLLQIQNNFENISLLSEFIPPEDDLSLSYMITVKSARSYSLCHLWWGSLGIIGSTKQISSYLPLHLASHEDTLFWTGRGKKYFFGQGGEETVNFVIYGASPELHSQAFWGSKVEATGKFSICIALMGTSAFCQNFWGSKFEGTGTLASCNFLSEKL